jgi:hypothetical protein
LIRSNSFSAGSGMTCLYSLSCECCGQQAAQRLCCVCLSSMVQPTLSPVRASKALRRLQPQAGTRMEAIWVSVVCGNNAKQARPTARRPVRGSRSLVPLFGNRIPSRREQRPVTTAQNNTERRGTSDRRPCWFGGRGEGEQTAQGGGAHRPDWVEVL